MPRPRITPSFVVAVLALVVASGGAGFAAGQITSADIKDGTILSRDVRNNAIASEDVRNGGLTGGDLRNRSVPRVKIDTGCPSGHYALFGGCVRKNAYSRSSHQAAIDDCNRRNGRLPTLLELTWIRTHTAEFVWADGNVSNYEFSGDYTTDYPHTPIALDAAGNSVENATAQLFWHHCVIY